jgi:peptidoglycan/LPS O-acetylase OafA/YrhL
MLGTIAFRWISYLCGANDLFYVLLPGSMGSLAAGALIAYVMRYDPKNTLLMTFSRWRPYLLLVCLPIIGAAIYFNNIVLWNAAFLFEPLMAACLVTLAIEGQRDWRTDWLANPIATYIGKISYGIYVYHYFVPDLIDSYIPNLHSYTATVCSHSSRAVS